MSIKYFDHLPQLKTIQSEIDSRFASVFQHGQFVQGPEVKEVEDVLANYLGVNNCISTSNGTDALLVALMAADINPGDEVITPGFSYIAAAESIKLLGATPVYIDVNSKTYNIDTDFLAAAINNKTKAIVAVDLFGQSADYDKIFSVIGNNKITVIEDAAQSFGSVYKNRKAGTLADIATTSFFPTKPLGCFGDGGAIFTDNNKLAEIIREITLHGQKKKYQHVRVGINGRLDTLQAAVLMAKLPHFNDDIDHRRQAARKYDDFITHYLSPWKIRAPQIEDHNQSVYAQYTIKIDKRDEIQQYLANRGIPTAIHYPAPIYSQWGESNVNHLPVTEKLCRSVISLPFYPSIPEGQQAIVIEAIADALSELIG
ncbi:MAG: DegT/DnrJ/EryC1/StrS family aminotransferase [Oceanicoccus sp.]